MKLVRQEKNQFFIQHSKPKNQPSTQLTIYISIYDGTHKTSC